MRRITITIAVVAMLTALAGLTACEIRPRHDFVVDVGSDGSDAAPGDGICAVAAPGGCTLRAALDEANALAASSLGPAPTFTITLETDVQLAVATGATDDANLRGDLDVHLGAASLTIDGAHHRVRVANAFPGPFERVLELFTGSLTLRQVEVTDGYGVGGGGGVRTGPGTSLVIIDSTFRENRAWTESGFCYSSPAEGCYELISLAGGGAIDAGGALAVTGSTFAANSANPIGTCFEYAGGTEACPAAWGGAILARGELAVLASTFDANRSTGDGSAIWAQGSSTVVSTTAVAGSTQIGPPIVATTVRSSILAREGCSNLALDADGNLVGQGACVAGAIGLAPLAANGGATPTRLPAAGSIVVDAVAPDGGGTCAGFPLDQRGLARPAGSACDVGAVERQPSDP